MKPSTLTHGLAAVMAGALLTFASSDASLAASATATASARVVAAPLQIVSRTTLRFGTVAPGGAAGSVTVATTGERTASGGARLLGGAAFGPAEFEISGQANTDYLISVPASIDVSHDSGTAIPGETLLVAVNLTTFSATVGAETDTGKLDPGGKDKVSVGGTLIMPARAKSGRYSGIVPLTVTYE